MHWSLKNVVFLRVTIPPNALLYIVFQKQIKVLKKNLSIPYTCSVHHAYTYVIAQEEACSVSYPGSSRC